MPPALLTSQLSLTFATARGPVDALREVSLHIDAGQFFGLFGPNGAGKTTLIRILTTLILPTRGTAQIHGHDVAREAAQVRKLIGVVFSNENSFYGRLTGRQNLEFFAALQNLDAPTVRQRMTEWLAVFDLTRAADAPFQTYSTGMRQKLNVIRALLSDPPVIFLDEPTKGMDVLTAETLRTLLRRELVEQRGKTVILTTHDLEEMELLCDQVGILEAGRLRAIGRPADLIREANASVVYRLELTHAPADLVEHLSRLDGVKSVAIVTRSEHALVLDVAFADSVAPEQAVWSTVVEHRARLKRFGPREEGLVSLLRG